MDKKLKEWARFGKALNIFTLLVFIALFFWFSFSGCEDIYIGKSREEIATELSQAMWEVDSILHAINFQLDSTYTDGSKVLQEINNGAQ